MTLKEANLMQTQYFANLSADDPWLKEIFENENVLLWEPLTFTQFLSRIQNHATKYPRCSLNYDR